MVRSLDNSSNNLLAHTRIFTRLILISILARFALGADPELKKYLSWRMLEKKVNRYMSGKKILSGFGQNKFLPKPNHPYPLPLKSKMVEPLENCCRS